MDLNVDLGQLANLDPNDIGNWPLAVRIAIMIAICLAVASGGYYLDTQHQLASLANARDSEQKLKTEFEQKQGKAANLGAYKQQMVEMEESFGTMLRQLPSKTEVAELLVDVTQTGLATGLRFELFKPLNELPKEFYAELPITLNVAGSYHQFGEFISGVAALPRIVTLHDIVIKRETKDSDTLTMQAMAKTYRYLEEGEVK